MKTRMLVTALLVALGSASAFAQTPAATVQRDVNQQTRIESGLKDGSLSTKEAGRLEKEQSQIDRLQAKQLKDGTLTPRERVQLNRAQNRASQDIKTAKSNDVKGDPASKSSERMQADVQRNVNQEKRVEQGINSGELTNREAGHLQAGQAKVTQTEAKVAKNGHVGAREQAAVQKKENAQSGKIHKKKHNALESKG